MDEARGVDDRTAKLREIQAQQRRSDRRGRTPWIGGTAVVLAALIGGGVWAITSNCPAGTSNNGIEGLATFTNLARDHVEGKGQLCPDPAGRWSTLRGLAELWRLPDPGAERECGALPLARHHVDHLSP